MKFTELYEVHEEYIEELNDVTEYGGIADALEMLGKRSSGWSKDIYKDPLLADWFKRHAERIAYYAIAEIMAEHDIAGIRYEASVIINAGIDLPDRTLTWYIQNMMPKLVRHLEYMSEDNPGGAVNCMVGLKKYHGIDIVRYVTPESIARIVTDCIIANNVRAAVHALTNILGANNTASVEYLNAYKREIVKGLLADMKTADKWELAVLNNTVDDLMSLGIAWPELEIIKDASVDDEK